MANREWNGDERAEFKKLWEQKNPELSVREIAQRLGRTMPAVLHERFRLRLTPRASPIKHKGLGKGTKIAGEATVPIQTTPPEKPNKSSTTCCWPIGEPGTKSFCFCSSPSELGHPYCASHCIDAYPKSSRLAEWQAKLRQAT